MDQHFSSQVLHGYRLSSVRTRGHHWSQSHEPLKRWGMTLWQAAERLHSKGYQHEYGKANASHSIELLAQLGVAILAKEKNDGGWHDLTGGCKLLDAVVPFFLPTLQASQERD